jgi:hypothetical protein
LSTYKRPLNLSAVAKADDALYRSHVGDPRPNAMFDAAGNRLPLDSDNPSQAGLREEWGNLYLANGGELQGTPTAPKQPVDTPCATCPPKIAHLTVTVHWTPMRAPIKGAVVAIDGPIATSALTDEFGQAHFMSIPAGGYSIEASYDSGHSLATLAKSKVGSASWAYDSARSPYPSGANKCNLFVYEMANQASLPVPKRERFSLSSFARVWFPPLAGEWADPATDVGAWAAVKDPRPGDVIAEAHDYADATGHVGILGDPDPTGMSRSVPPGVHEQVSLDLRRVTISAGGDEVLRNDWGWRSGQKPSFKRYK